MKTYCSQVLIQNPKYDQPY